MDLSFLKGLVVKNKYKIGAEISKVNYGTVFKCYDSDKVKYEIKVS